jgi:hypothetical protein
MYLFASPALYSTADDEDDESQSSNQHQTTIGGTPPTDPNPVCTSQPAHSNQGTSQQLDSEDVTGNHSDPEQNE